MGSIVFVHGTGVRKEGYQQEFKLIQTKLGKVDKSWDLVECLWGDQHGIKLHLQGKSIPKYPDKPPEQDDLMRWWRLYQDPLYELRELASIEEGQVWIAPGQETAWETLDKTIRAFSPAGQLSVLLKDANLDEVWNQATDQVLKSDEYEGAVERSSSHPGFFRRAFARAVYAQATMLAAERGASTPSGDLRDQIMDQVVQDLGGEDLGLPDLGKMAMGALKFVGNLIKANGGMAGVYSGVFSRGKITDNTLPKAGDILLYQTRGKAIRDFIRDKIVTATPPVYLLAHSLGGIACVDLLAMEPLPVSGLITAGSQAPLLYEMNCLTSLEDGAPLPAYFPKKWLNFYDPNDLLSYIGEKVFPNRVKDVEITSRQPFPQSHSSYWHETRLWEEIKNLLNSPA